MARTVIAEPTPPLDQPASRELIGRAIRARRTQLSLRIEDAAPLCGVSTQTLARIERADSSAQLENVLDVCKGLGIRLFIEPWEPTR